MKLFTISKGKLGKEDERSVRLLFWASKASENKIIALTMEDNVSATIAHS